MEVFFNLFRATNALYVDTTDPEGMINTAINAMLEDLDPYTEYIPESNMANFDFMTTGKYAGIGSLIRQRGPWTEISEPYKGTPADRAGLKAGDRLLEIDGVSLENIGSEKVSAMLKGEPNTDFTLKFRPLSDTTITKTVKITREKIVIPSIPYYGIIGDNVGYISFTSFTDDCATQFRAAFEKLRSGGKLKGLVIDLRGNGGGIVDGAVKIAGMFLPQGTEITSLKGRSSQSNQVYHSKSQPIDTTIPLAVLINRSSASASEILAGAIQDLDRGVIIGSRSFGKGLVQTTRPVADKALLKVTIAKYYTPAGRCIQSLDYSHRNEDGSVKHVPDSIIKQFTTAAGRKVYDGGGINPDVKTEAEYWSKFTAILVAYGFIEDFSSVYAAKNLPQTLENFRVDDNIYGQFIEFMKDKKIEYKSSTQVALEQLRKDAQNEKYTDRIAPLLDSIEVQIRDDKNAELDIRSKELKEAIASAIVKRWYYSNGAIEYNLKHNAGVDMEKALEILSNPVEYKRILREQDTTKN